MDLSEQNTAIEEVEQILLDKFKGKNFHAIIAMESDEDKGLVFSVGTLDGKTPIDAWKLILAGFARHTRTLWQRFNIPEDLDFMKPVQPK